MKKLFHLAIILSFVKSKLWLLSNIKTAKMKFFYGQNHGYCNSYCFNYTDSLLLLIDHCDLGQSDLMTKTIFIIKKSPIIMYPSGCKNVFMRSDTNGLYFCIREPK